MFFMFRFPSGQPVLKKKTEPDTIRHEADCLGSVMWRRFYQTGKFLQEKNKKIFGGPVNRENLTFE